MATVLTGSASAVAAAVERPPICNERQREQSRQCGQQRATAREHGSWLDRRHDSALFAATRF